MHKGQKRAVITGGSSGIGLALAEALDRSGYVVFNLDLHAPNTKQAGLFVETDVCQEGSVKRASQVVPYDIDLLVNNAGIISHGSLFETSIEQYQKILDVNLKGSWLVIQHLFLKLKANSTVLQIASSVAIDPEPSAAIYSISKTAALSLMLVLQKTKPALHVKVAFPGPVDTPLFWQWWNTQHPNDKAKPTPESPVIFASRVVDFLNTTNEVLLYDQQKSDYVFKAKLVLDISA